MLALAQSGQPAQAREALAETLRAFRQIAAATPLSGWPASFWSLLLAQPELAEGRPTARELAALADGPRITLLLRLIAGLDAAHAAQVLGLGESAYRQASQRALQQFGDAGFSYADLAALRERLHQQVKSLPAADLAILSQLHQNALSDTPPTPPAQKLASPWPRRLAWSGLTVLLLALAASFLPQAERILPPPALPPGAVQALPAEPLPSRTAVAPSDVIAHPDFAQLIAPEEARLAQDLALLAWLEAEPGAFEAEPPPEEGPDSREVVNGR